MLMFPANHAEGVFFLVLHDQLGKRKVPTLSYSLKGFAASKPNCSRWARSLSLYLNFERARCRAPFVNRFNRSHR